MIDDTNKVNQCCKRRPADDPYEIYKSPVLPGWEWRVLKKYASPDQEAKNKYATWFCLVKSPIFPDGELGDVYIADILVEAKGKLIKRDLTRKNKSWM